MVVICFSIIISDVDYLIMCWFAKCILWNVCSNLPPMFLKSACLFLRVLYSEYKSFIRYMICIFFLPVCDLSFHSLNCVFWTQKLFILLKSNLFSALAGVAQWIEHQPVNWKIASLIPSHGTCLGCRPGPHLGACERQPIDVSLAHWCAFMFLSLSFSLLSLLSRSK